MTFKTYYSVEALGKKIELHLASEIYPDIPLGTLSVDGIAVPGTYLHTPILLFEENFVVSRYQRDHLVKLEDGSSKKFSFALMVYDLRAGTVLVQNKEFALIRPLWVTDDRIVYSTSMFPEEEIVSGSMLFPSDGFTPQGPV